MSSAIEKYFYKKLAKSFYNYKNIKGFIGVLLTKLFTYIYSYELMHFELPMADSAYAPFLSNHQNMEDLIRLYNQRKLSIELVLDAVDFQNGKYFCVKFIDPDSLKYKIIKFND